MNGTGVNSADKIQAYREAADWLLTLEATPEDVQQHEAFEIWLSARPENVAAWAAIANSWSLLGESLGRDGDDQVEDTHSEHSPAPVMMVPSMMAAPAHSVLRMRPQRAPRQVARTGSAKSGAARDHYAPWTKELLSRVVNRRGAAIAATFFLLIAAVLSYSPRGQADYSTVASRSQDIVLEDGSVVHLASDSAIDVHYSRLVRELVLKRGEAFFEVQKNPRRPFKVIAGDVSITVLGTAFDVALGSDEIDVSVQHGRVEVASLDQTMAHKAATQVLGAGQGLSYLRSSGHVRRYDVVPRYVASWRDGLLFVDQQPIGAIVEKIARYKTGWVIVARNDIARRKVTGLYDLKNPDKALDGLVRAYNGKVYYLTPFLTVLSE
jgi:transmembrane sensor